MQSIHCKISLDDQYRRFLFKYSLPLPSTSLESGVVENPFKQLQNQVRTLYGFGGDFVLKYKDDEGDLIIIESEEEFNCAVAQSAGLLRLFIQLKDEPMTDATTSTTTTSASPSTYNGPDRFGHPGRGRCGRGHGPYGGHWAGPHHGRRGHYHGHGHGHGYEHPHPGKHGRGGKFNIEKLAFKREMIAAVLNDPQFNTDELRKLKLQRKLECIDRRLAILNSESNHHNKNEETSSSSSDEKWRNKKCDKYKKCHGKNEKRQRRVRRNLTDDDRAALLVLKTQIWEMKPAFVTVKIQVREKKEMKADAKKKGDYQRVEELKKEIQQLKEIKREHKNAIAPLKRQIYALKFEQI